MSADLNPLAHDTLFASPALAGAEFRNIADHGTPTVVTSAAVAPIQRTNELVFVDTATPDYQTLIDEMRESALGQGRHFEFVLIDQERDGIRKITDTLAKKSDLDAIHIISHAQDGSVQLGSSKLDFDSLVKRAASIKRWGEALTEAGDILFYGCDLAASAEGKSLLDALSRLTGADVAASEDPTGSAAQGGDWELEFRTGAVEAEVSAGPAVESSWDHTLATFTVTTTADTGPGSLRAAITSANAAGADTINFNISTADPNYNAATGTWTITVGTAASGNTALPVATGAGGALTIDGSSQPGYAGTPLIQIVAGNVTGSGAGARDGLSLAAANSVVRGLTISGFSSDGLQLDGDNIIIAGNYIGTNAAGSAAAANGTGININAGNGDTIGGAVAADRNVISGNTDDGIFIASTDGHTIAGNFIGTNATAAAGLGNGRDGVRLAGDNDLVTIGGATAPDANVIAFNTGSAVNVLDVNADQNTIRRNAIHGNTAGGIVLAGHTQEAFGGFDPDAGANQGQNYPDFTAATVSIVNGNLVLSGMTLSTTANSSYNIDFYANPAAGTLQGNRYLGTLIAVPTDGAGNIVPLIVTLLNKSLLAGDRITATATGVAGGTPAAEIGNTSPMSTTFVTVPLAGTLSLSGTVYEDVNGDGSIADGVGRSGVLVKLYADNGDNTPGLHDQLITTTTTVAGGGYTFNSLTNGTYWVVVDSRTITSSLGLLGGHVAGETWAEETYATANNTAIGSAGAIRAVSYNGSYQFATATGAFLGGLAANRSDDATTLSATTTVGAEHVQLVSVSNANVAGVDSAYSFTAIVNDRGDAADDDTGAARMQQGSLRQFIQNSNAIGGTQTSNFSIGATGSTKTIAPTAALPTITDAVILDAWTQGAAGYTGPPLIELNGAGAGAGAHGFDLLADGSTVRGFVINRFGQSGIRIDSDGNTVAGNWIGLDTTGMVGAGNGIDGVVLVNLAANNTIGGTGANDGNVLSDNGDEGVSIDGAIGTLVVGNYIGTDATGTVAIGNGGDGVAIQFGAVNSTVGGTTAAERNVIAGNGSNSANGLANVRIRQTGTTSNVVLGNYIGTNWNATATLGNPGYGVLVSEDAFGNMIGGTAAGAGNVIAGSALDGIAMIDAVTGNRALGNVLYGNAGLGIDLADDGVSANDAGDGDAGANGLQNFPVIATANVNGADITITGSLDSTDTRTFRIEFFASSAADGSGHGEGQRYLGFTTVTIAGGATAFSVTLTPAIAVAGGEYVSATATDLTSNETSEFSLAHTANTAPVNTVPATATVNEDTAFAFNGGNLISVADGQSNVNQVVLTVANGTLNVTPAGAAVAGNGSLSVTITGTQAAINATLASLSYQGTLNYNGADTLTVVSTDAGGMQDTVAVAITVNPVNDAPVAVNDSYAVAEDSTLTVGWWDTDWTVRRQITFNNTNVGGFAPAETLSNFPVLLVLDAAKVDYALTQDDGGDLRFFDADGTPLAYEIERWDEAGNSYVWVKVPQIDIGATDSITMYYGNASVADGEDSSAVWAGTGYRSVYHLDDVGPTVQDATSTNYDGTATNGATGGQTGQIGSAYGFDAADDYINLGDDRSFIDGASAATFSAWVRPNDNDGVNPNIILSASINSGGAPSGTSRMAIELDPFGDIKFIVRADDSANTTVFTTGTPVTAGTWHYVTGVVDLVTNEVTVYVDGVARPITAGPYTLPGTAFPNSPSGSASIGSSDEGAGPYFDGRIDEARIATAARTAGWIQAEYRAMSNQAGTAFVAFGTAQGAPALGGVLNNDADAEGNRLTSTVVTNVSNGTLTLNGDGTFSYTPIANFNGTDTFTYRANDGTNNSNVATVTITVNPVNDAPTLGNGTLAAIAEDTASPAGQALSTIFSGQFADIDAGSSFGGIAVVGNTANAGTQGTWQYSTNAGTNWFAIGAVTDGASALALSSATLVRFVPVANYNGTPPALTVRGLDNTYAGGFSTTAGAETRVNVNTSTNGGTTAIAAATATLSTSVSAVNDTPTTSGLANVTVNEDAPDTVVNLFAAFADVEDADPALVYTVVGNTNAALFTSTAVNGAAGTLTLDYAPNAFGTADLTVRATDTSGAFVDTTFTVTVNPVNDTPTTSGLANVTVNEDAPDTVVNLFAAFADVEDADPALVYTVVGNTNAALFTSTAVNGAAGTLTLDYAPNAFGTADLTVRATDTSGAFVDTTFTVTVNPVNDTPTTSGLANVTVNEDAPDTVVNLFAAFADVEDADPALVYTVVGNTNAALFTSTAVNGAAGTLTLDYAPNAFGTADLTVRATDTSGAFVDTTFTVTVNPVNDTPTTSGLANVTVNEDAPDTVVNLFAAFADVEDADPALVYTVVGNTNAALFTSTAVNGAAGTLTLDYAPNAFGTADLTVRATDTSGAFVDTTFTVTVNPVNDTPTTSGLANVTVNEDAPDTVVNLFAAFADVEDADPALVYTVVGNTNAALFTSTAVNGAAGTLTLDYAPNAFGTADLTVRATDTSGAFVDTTFTVTVNPVNDTPTTSGLANVTVNEDAPDTVVNLFAAFADVEDADPALVYTVVGNTNAALFTSTAVNGAAGTLTLDYAPNAFGTADLTVRATDTSGAFVDTTFTVTVNPVNDTPTTSGLANVTVNEDAPDTVVNLFAAFADVEDADPALVYTVVGNTNAALFTSTAVNGAAGTLTLDYAPNAFGTADLTVRATDTSGAFVDTTFTVTVNPVNDTPTTSGLANVTVNEDAPDTVVNLFAAFADVEDADPALVYTVVGNTNAALFTSTAVNGAAGTLTLDYAPNAFGTADLTVRATDTSGAFVDTTFTVTVNPVNDTPTTSGLANVTVNEDAPDTVVNLFAAFADVEDADPALVYTVVGNTNAALFTSTAVNGAAGTLTLDYAPNAFGTADLTVRATDTSGAFVDTTFTVTVNPVNDTPMLVDNAFAITNNGSLALAAANLSATDIDDAIATLAFTVAGVTNGRFELAAAPGVAITSFTQQQILDGEVVFVHDGSGNAPTFTVLVSDGTASDGPYLGNVVFSGGGGSGTGSGGVVIAPPTGGGGAAGDGTITTISPPAAPPAPQPEESGVTNPATQEFLRAPTTAPASGDGDAAPIDTSAAPPRQAAGAELQKVAIAVTELPSVRAEGETVTLQPAAQEVQVEPVVAEMRVLPVRGEADADDEERTRVEVLFSSIKITGLAMSVGAVWWAARAAGLMASLLASSPAWRHVDPLPVLGRDDEEEEVWDETAEEEDKDRKDDEHRAAWVLEEREAS